jgi:TPR repeat protein
MSDVKMMQLSDKLSSEKLPVTSTEELSEDRIEFLLQEHLQSGNRNILFPLGQFYFEQCRYDKAMHYFELAANDNDWQAIFQLGVMYYDGLNCPADLKRGFELMHRVATSDAARAYHLVRVAQFNVGRAYYQGYGTKRSDDDAERFWLLAADNGNPKACIKAQSTLGLFYSLRDHLDLKKAFFWHSEACGNGSLESQGALGVMFLEGLGVKQDFDKAFICLKDATSRGNIYAMGHLVAYYYKHKLYTKAVELAARVSQCEDTAYISQETDCMEEYIKKGISMACFYYARCLSLGRGVQEDEHLAKSLYSQSFKFDADVCARLQKVTQQGDI